MSLEAIAAVVAHGRRIKRLGFKTFPVRYAQDFATELRAGGYADAHIEILDQRRSARAPGLPYVTPPPCLALTLAAKDRPARPSA